MDYVCADFYDSLDETGRNVSLVIHEHIVKICPEYLPAVSVPEKKTSPDMLLEYRKKTKTGKAVCTLQSIDGKLNVRVCFLTSMVYDVLLHQNEFSAKFKNTVLAHTICCVDKGCRCYGGNTPCVFRQNFWINHRLIKACPYPWIYFDALTESDADDIRLLLDLQLNNMTQNAREIKGSGYTERNAEKCGDVDIITLGKTDLRPNLSSDYGKKETSLDRYAKLYRLTAMGANDGEWYFHDAASSAAYVLAHMPQGKYASVTVTDPLKFSAVRVWNYLADYISAEKISVREVNLDAQTIAVFFVKFCTEDGAELMKAFVPV